MVEKIDAIDVDPDSEIITHRLYKEDDGKAKTFKDVEEFKLWRTKKFYFLNMKLQSNLTPF